MKKVAIFMSDFHLGQGDQMEEFHADEEFAELLGRLSLEHKADDVDLVLLGDIVDLWTTADAAEIRAQTAKEIHLPLPVASGDTHALIQAAATEKTKLDAILDAHPLFFQSLRRFLSEATMPRKLVYIFGNHDHSVVHPDLQQSIRNCIVGNGANAAVLDSRIEFRCCYGERDDEQCLQVYAEHGNQLTYGGIFRYEHFESFGGECPGYVQFKLVSNRMERKAPELNGVFMEAFSPAMWPGILWWLLIKGHVIVFAQLGKFQIQFMSDDRAAVKWARGALPSTWKSVLNLWKSGWLGATKDEFSNAIPELFNSNGGAFLPLAGKPLDPLRVKTIILGHSHQPRDKDLPFPDGMIVKYYNTGGWLLRHENGRQVIEQNWVTISAEIGAGDGKRSIIDREMNHRKVQRAGRADSPVTADGRPLNPIMRTMDLRVGDVVLFRENYGNVIIRMLRQGRFLEFIGSLFGMAVGFINRQGTGSYWNHAALVYGTPSEKEEAEAYNDPLFLESVPGEGVAIHGPRHYLEHAKDWNIAVLRLKASWLHDPLEGWNRRRLLRRLALGSLQAQYDMNEVRHQTFFYAGLTMQERGRSLIGGIVKGAIAGVLVALLFLGLRGGFSLWNSGAGYPLAASAKEAFHEVIQIWDDTAILPYVKVNDLLSFMQTTDDAILSFVWHSMLVIVAVVMAIAIVGILASFLRVWIGLNVFYCIGWGLLMVPPLAEMSERWRERSLLTRWIVTLLWMGIPLTVLVLTPWLITIAKDLVSLEPVQTKWLAIELTAGLWIAIVALVLFATPILLWIGDFFVRIFGVVIAHPWARGKSSIFRWASGLQWTPAKKLPLDPDFLCSALVQHSLIRTAQQVAVPGALADVDMSAPWKDYLPKHFAASDKFEWVYLLLGGRLRHLPPPSHVAQADPPPQSAQPRVLAGQAFWCALFACLAAFTMILSDVLKIKDCRGQFFSCASPGGVWVTFAIASGCAILALILGRIASRRLSLEPMKTQGLALTVLGSFIALLTLIGSLLVMKARTGSFL